jgi:serine/threonine-protein kinase
MRATLAGVIMGTAAYMSPEQARGSVVDRRADIWAFGVMLYEMLTGRQMFAGETVSDTLCAAASSATGRKGCGTLATRSSRSTKHWPESRNLRLFRRKSAATWAG